MSRVALIALPVIVAVVASPGPAFAERAGAYGDPGGAAVFAGNSGGPEAGSGGPAAWTGGRGAGGPAPTCIGDAGGELDPASPDAILRTGAIEYRPATPNMAAALEQYDPRDAPGTWYLKTCGGAYYGWVWVPDGPAGAPAIEPANLAQEAFNYLPLPAPAVTMTPPPDKVLVNAPLWLSIDDAQWSPRQATASVPGVSATVVAVPERVVWRMGDGREVTCSGPGKPYDPTRPYEGQLPECGYTYARSSAGRGGLAPDAYMVTATVEWRATWTSIGVLGGGDLGVVSRTSSPIAVRVNEIQTVVIASNGGRP